MSGSPPRDGRSLSSLLEDAVSLALEAGSVTLRHFGGVVAAESKADGTPVTRADREAEQLLRSRIRSLYPGHSIVGEEFGEDEGTEPVRWILDPIDGTRAFARGVPLYSVLIGVEIEGEPVVGVTHFPALDETVAAARGEGCRWWPRGSRSPVQARVSDVDAFDRSLALTTDLDRILKSPVAAGWRTLSGKTEFVRGWGDAYGHALVATGRAEIMVDPVLEIWDAAPLLPIVVEAGGRFTDLQGNETIRGRSGVSTNGRRHEEVLAILRGEQVGEEGRPEWRPAEDEGS